MSEIEEGTRQRPDLRRFLEPRPRITLGKECEFCSELVGPHHPHVVQVETRQLMCACQGCALVFTPEGAGGGRYRVVPRRRLRLSGSVFSEAAWDALDIPVSMAFFFFNSTQQRTVAFYPSPGGATESLLSMETWNEMQAVDPRLRSLEPDVEALMVRRSAEGVSAFIVPIDACYELVGRIRRKWKGFQGGDDLDEELDAFFKRLDEESETEEEPCG